MPDMPSAADEIAKFARLAGRGYLSPAEMQQQKDGILFAASHGELSAEDLTADELTRLADLVDQAILSRDEFDLQKATLLWADLEEEDSADSVLDEDPDPSGSDEFTDADEPELPAIPRGWEWVLIAAGALAAIGSLLPWEQASTGFGSISRNGFQMGTNLSFSWDGLVMMVLGVLAALVGITRLTGHAFPRWLNSSPTLLGIVILLVAVPDHSQLSNTVRSLQAKDHFGVFAVGYGLEMCIAGGAAIAFAGIAGWIAERRQLWTLRRATKKGVAPFR